MEDLLDADLLQSKHCKCFLLHGRPPRAARQEGVRRHSGCTAPLASVQSSESVRARPSLRPSLRVGLSAADSDAGPESFGGRMLPAILGNVFGGG